MENQDEFQNFLTTEGNDLALMFDSTDERAAAKAEALQSLITEKFNNFLREIDSLAEKVPMKHKVKVILFVE